VVSEKESYFEKEEKRIVGRGMEYAPEKFIVCLQNNENFYMIDRHPRLTATPVPVRWKSHASMPCSTKFEIIKMPGFNASNFPFLLMRDDYHIYVFNVNTRRLYDVKSAFYDNLAGYKTLDLITHPKTTQEFEAVFLETGKDENSKEKTTTINRISFTQIFMDTLKQVAN
jgi:hypothetical protein